jgi:hypothetical protein
MRFFIIGPSKAVVDFLIWKLKASKSESEEGLREVFKKTLATLSLGREGYRLIIHKD